ncbi:MAG: hypothetical protein L6R00_21555 [Phycisphaerae bacterium]|nr:hypothetical protein [Phycisphaerae bacterium]
MESVAHVLQHVAAQGGVERIVLERPRHGVEIVDNVHARPRDGIDVDKPSADIGAAAEVQATRRRRTWWRVYLRRC